MVYRKAQYIIILLEKCGKWNEVFQIIWESLASEK